MQAMCAYDFSKHSDKL
jgi:hypothetical protein